MAEDNTILVVEDDVSLMQGIRDILQIRGYKVITATSGVEGIEVMQAVPTPPDLILSDIMMPYMDGYTFLAEVRKQTRWTKIPFIFLTAKGERHDVLRGKSMGVEDYMVKPFEPDELIVAVSSKLRRSQEISTVTETQFANLKTSILTILNHEFRTPMTYIVAYSDMANQDAETMSTAEMKVYLSGINTGANRLRRLVENFILLVELHTGEAVNTFNLRQRYTNDYDTILRSAINYVEEFAQEKQVTVQVDYPQGTLPAINCDPDYLQVAVSRLLDNAIKFSNKPNSRVFINIELHQEMICFIVADEGRGIPEDQQEQIFSTFYQINRPIYEDQGAGSGLAVVDQIVKLHNGNIVLQSEPGVGSKFAICIPLT